MAKKKSRLRKLAKKVGRSAGKVLRVAAPVAPVLLGGLGGVGAGAGAAVLGSALAGGNRKKKLKALRRSGVAVGAAAAGTAALGLVSGQGIGASAISSIGSFFGSPSTTTSSTTTAFPFATPASMGQSGQLAPEDVFVSSTPIPMQDPLKRGIGGGILEQLEANKSESPSSPDLGGGVIPAGGIDGLGGGEADEAKPAGGIGLGVAVAGLLVLVLASRGKKK